MATEYGGYMGKILRIDLTTETAEEYPFTDLQRRETLGGKALAYRILAEQLTGKETAFSEENLLILSTGPLTGTGAPGSARFEITTISPKSNMPVSSNCGGNFGVFLKKAGYDALILSGQCKRHRRIEITETDMQKQRRRQIDPSFMAAPDASFLPFPVLCHLSDPSRSERCFLSLYLPLGSLFCSLYCRVTVSNAVDRIPVAL